MSKAFDEIMGNRLDKLARLQSLGVNPYPNDFRPDTSTRDLKTTYAETPAEELEKEERTFNVAGRIMSLRGMGKATFFHLKDRYGQIQVYVRKDRIGEPAWAAFEQFEVGDIVGVKGRAMRTRTGELTVLAGSLRMLCKSLRPLPEKFHGLQDVELRFRQRYVDLIMNDNVRELFVMRTRITGFIRRFLDERGFLDVETPMMHPLPGGAAARPFVTHHNALDVDLYLRIAPELYLKRLLVGGLEKVYEINRNFRNEGLSHKHNPEFTMLEFYWAYATYEDLIRLTEEMIHTLFVRELGLTTARIGDKDVSLVPPYRRLAVVDSLTEVGGIPKDKATDPAFLVSFLKRFEVDATEAWGLGKLQMEAYDKAVEPQLLEPTFIMRHPVETSPLSRRNEQNPEVVDRFELVIGGREIANAFSELNDPRDQRGRFEQQMKDRAAGDEEAHRLDEDFLRALEYGMPPAAGEGIGIDRLVMLAAGVDNIKEVILFPLLRPEQDE